MRVDPDGISVRHIRYFLALVREESVSGAADVLRIAQPSLSQQLRKLEARLGILLFDRTPSGVVLTESGRRFLAGIEPALAFFDDAVAEARAGIADQPWRVAICSGVSAELVTRIVQALSSKGLGATRGPVELSSASSADQVALLLHDEIDFGILRAPFDQDGIAAAVASEETLGVAMGLSHPLASFPELRWRDLMGQRLLWFETNKARGFSSAVSEAIERSGWTPELLPTPSRHVLFQHALLAHDDIIALRPRSAVVDTALVWRPLMDVDVPKEIIAVTARRGGVNKAFLIDIAQSQGWRILY